MLFSPTFNHDLLIRVKLNGITPLRVHVAEETAFPSGEGEIAVSYTHLTLPTIYSV